MPTLMRNSVDVRVVPRGLSPNRLCANISTSAKVAFVLGYGASQNNADPDGAFDKRES